MAAARHLEVYAGQVVANDQHIGLLRNLFLSFRKSLLNVKVLGAVHLLFGLGVHLLINAEHVIDRNLILHKGMEERSLPLESHAHYQARHIALRYIYLAVLETSLQQFLAGLSLAVANLVDALTYAHAGTGCHCNVEPVLLGGLGR